MRLPTVIKNLIIPFVGYLFVKNLDFSFPKNELLISTSTSLPTKSCLCNPWGEATPQGASTWCKHWWKQGSNCTWSHIHFKRFTEIDVPDLVVFNPSSYLSEHRAESRKAAASHLSRQQQAGRDQAPTQPGRQRNQGTPVDSPRHYSVLGQRRPAGTEGNPFLQGHWPNHDAQFARGKLTPSPKLNLVRTKCKQTWATFSRSHGIAGQLTLFSVSIKKHNILGRSRHLCAPFRVPTTTRPAQKVRPSKACQSTGVQLSCKGTATS